MPATADGPPAFSAARMDGIALATLLRYVTGCHDCCAASTIAWIANFGVAKIMKVSQPAALSVAICELTLGSDVSYDAILQMRFWCEPRPCLRPAFMSSP